MATMFPITMVAAIRDVQKHNLTGSDRRKRLIGALATANAPAAGLLLGQRQTREALDDRDDDGAVIDQRPQPGETASVPVDDVIAMFERVGGSNETAVALGDDVAEIIREIQRLIESGKLEATEPWGEWVQALAQKTEELTKQIASTDTHIDASVDALSG